MKERKADSKVSEIGAFSYFVHRNQTTVRITNPKNGVGSEIVLVYYIQKLDSYLSRHLRGDQVKLHNDFYRTFLTEEFLSKTIRFTGS